MFTFGIVSKVKPKFEIYIYIKLTVCDLTAIHWWLNKLQQIYDYKVLIGCGNIYKQLSKKNSLFYLIYRYCHYCYSGLKTLNHISQWLTVTFTPCKDLQMVKRFFKRHIFGIKHIAENSWVQLQALSDWCCSCWVQFINTKAAVQTQQIQRAVFTWAVGYPCAE